MTGPFGIYVVQIISIFEWISCRSSLNSAKCGMVVKSKIRKKKRSRFLMFCVASSMFTPSKYKHFTTSKFTRTSDNCRDTGCGRPSRSPCFLLADSFLSWIIIFTQPIKRLKAQQEKGLNGSPILF
jgi:hypothetical protein